MKKYLLLLFVCIAPMTMAGLPIRIDSFTCTGNEDYCQNLNCSVENIRNKMQVLNFDCSYPKEMNSLKTRFSLFKKYGTKYRHFLIDVSENLCKVLDRTERSNIISRMLPMWKNYGHFPNSCPIKGDISVKRYPLDFSFFPTTFPIGDFKIILQISEAEKKISILNVTTTFKVIYS